MVGVFDQLRSIGISLYWYLFKEYMQHYGYNHGAISNGYRKPPKKAASQNKMYYQNVNDLLIVGLNFSSIT